MSDGEENSQEITPSDSVSLVSYSSSQTLSAPEKTRSKIWPHFEVILSDDDTHKPLKAKCIYNNCQREFYCKNGSTGSMGMHLKRDHSFDRSYNPPDGFVQTNLGREPYGSNGNVAVMVRILFVVTI